MKKVIIDFLYLDLNTCKRCIATDEILKKALDILSPVFKVLDYQVKTNTVNIRTRELAEEYKFVTSPTIRVNGIDICNEFKENDCKDCGDLCGDNVNCRIFTYEGNEYEQPPVPAIIDGILKVLYKQEAHEDKIYTLPQNLDKFFTGKSNSCDNSCGCNESQQNIQLKGENEMNEIKIYEPAMCCSTGLCGVNINKELLRVSTTINALQKKGVKIERYNLSNSPKEFISNKVVNEYINKNGTKALPVIIVNGEIVKMKAYPTNEEFEKWSGVKLYNNKDQTNSSGYVGGCC
ncbi:MAG: arsenite efflux transporter metallochaperone ArsD [Clostridia bacterium]|nr:arsenite efflux transporter metallochaperone ArsD [Clostridia bacterium]